MKTYEITYIIPEKFEEKEIPQITEKIKKIIPDGRITKENFWGRRLLAYPISKNKFGYYVTLVFQTEPENIEKIGSKLNLEEDVIRYLIVSTKPPVQPKEIKEPEKAVGRVEAREEKPEEKPSLAGKPKKIEIPKIKVRAKPKKIEKPKKAKITEEIEKEEEKMKALDEKLEEILKE